MLQQESWDLDPTEQFYRRLLGLHRGENLERIVEDALKLVVEISGAQIAYLELYVHGVPTKRFWKGHGVTDATLEGIRGQISSGVIAFALAEGQTIETASALADASLMDLGSVKQNQIGAVLCAPVGTGTPIGVVYLQGRNRPGRFGALDRERVELFCEQLAQVASRLLGLTLTNEMKQFEQHRAAEALDRNDGNLSATARELGIGRAWLRTILRRRR